MRYERIDNSLFTSNRKNYIKKVDSGSASVFISNDELPTNADELLPFVQNTNLLYLTGIDQEDTFLILAPQFPDKKMREILFIKETSEEIAIWEGNKLTKEEASKISGIETVLWNDQFENIFPLILAQIKDIYLEKNEHIRSKTKVETAQDRFIKKIKSEFSSHSIKRSYPILSELRMVKSDIEVTQIQKACDITELGFRRVLGFIKPGIWEYEIEAEYFHEFLNNRSKGFAYQPIIASGINSCCLHYNTNNMQCKDGDMVLMDVGSEYANYRSDMTRTVPINGKFSKRQLQIYNAVLNVKNEANKILRPGTSIDKYHKEIAKIMESELLDIKLIDKTDIKKQNQKNPAYKRYFMHGTSHHLGLDVHDVGNFYEDVKAGNVFTIEPGIYIKEEKMGIRLEDDILVGNNNNINLMEKIPIQPEEIEDIMN
ncbi:MAG: M24 family metallopeptidase [Flammeovirgaceae bacterium TMED290]|nr:MAG: M24 family metallopeptidase [Flammeovirgaceae bacterium TMED290]|tara:strand:+ start:1800 stop:3086 length:1287 start_codon:yes stop_codon:yes gene_type:complete